MKGIGQSPYIMLLTAAVLVHSDYIIIAEKKTNHAKNNSWILFVTLM